MAKPGEHTWNDHEMRRTIEVYNDNGGSVPHIAIIAVCAELNDRMRKRGLHPDLSESKVSQAISAVRACDAGRGRRPCLRLRVLWQEMTGRPSRYVDPARRASARRAA